MAEWNLKAENLVPWGHNPWYQPLQPGHSYTMDNPHFDDDGVKGHYVKTVVVLPEPKEFNIASIGGKFKCAVVEEKEFLDKLQFSRSLNYYCFDKTTKTVYTMGEHAWETKNARGDMSDTVTESWIVGDRDSNGEIEAGMIMPGTWMTGTTWIIDGAEGQAFVGGEAAESGLSIVTPAGAFDNCVRTREYDILDPGDITDKVWCYGVGLVSDTSDGLLFKTAHLPKGTKPEVQTYHAYHSAKASGKAAAQLKAKGAKMASGKKSNDEIKAIAVAAVPGKAVDVAIEKKLGANRYVVEVLSKKDGGAEVDVIIDMATYKVIAIDK
jgi:uncharacterized membrane protein YkoI